MAGDEPCTLSSTRTAAGGEAVDEARATYDVDALPERAPSRYRIIGEQGRGGIGQVLRAHDQELGRTVAIKQLQRPRPSHVARFVREALITARLEHPAIVPVHDAGRWHGVDPFYAMKLVSGEPLRDLIARCASLAERLALLPHLIAVADAVAYAHSHRIIHRDLKPSNVLVGSYGETVVIDWGLAKQLDDADLPADEEGAPYRARASGLVTIAGEVVGTPAYMAPEQAAAETVDERADVYALGAMLYHLLTGQPPYEATTSHDILLRVLQGPPPRLAARAPDAPADLIAIADKAMARDLAGRYRTAAGVVEDLKRFQTGQLVGAHRYTARQLVGRWLSRHRHAVGVAVLATAALLTVGALSLHRVLQARADAADNAAVAERRLVDSYVDRGRRALLAGDANLALLFLAEAYADGARGLALKRMLHLAAQPFSSEQVALDAGARVWEVTYGPDGDRLIAATADGARVWDRRGKLLLSLGGHQAEVYVARFSPDGRVIVTADRAGVARVWDAASGRERAVLRGHDGWITDAVFTPAGTELVTSSQDSTLRVWDAATGVHQLTLRGHEAAVEKLAMHPREPTVASVSADGTARLWLLDRAEARAVLRGHVGPIRNVAFDATGDRLVTAGEDHRAIIWDARGGQALNVLKGHAQQLMTARFSPDGAAVLTAGLEPTARIWDAATGQLLVTLRGHSGATYWADFTPDGQRVVTASWDGTARVWDRATGTTAAQAAGHGAAVVWAAISPDGERFATSSWDGGVKVWDARAAIGRTVLLPNPAIAAEAVAFAPDGEAVATAGEGGRIAILDVGGRGQRWARQAGDGPIYGAQFSPDGRWLATSGATGAALWDARNGARVRSIELGELTLSVAFDATGERLAVAGITGTVHVVDATTGALLRELAAHDGFAFHAAFSPDGTRLVTAGADQTARVFDLVTGERLLTLSGHDYFVQRAVFSPRGDRIVTSSYDGTVRVWDAQDGSLLRTLTGHGNEVMDLALSSDGAIAAVAAGESVTLWELATAREIAVLRGHAGRVNGVAFSPDGSELASAGVDSIVSLWDIREDTRSPGDIARLVACRVPLRLEHGFAVPANTDDASCAPSL